VLISPYLSQELELGPGAIGAVVGVFGFASLLARLPSGMAYSSRRRRKLLLLGGGLSCAAFLLVPVVSGPVPFAALMALDGFGWSVATTTQLAAVVAARPGGIALASAMGWYSGMTGLGNTAGGALGGVVADRLGFAAGFLTLAGLVALGTAAMVLAAPSGSGDAPVATSSPRSRMRGHAREAWAAIVHMPLPVWIGMLVMVYINFASGIVQTFHPVLVLAAGLTLSEVGVLSSCRSWASSTVRLGSGPLFARIGRVNLTLPLVFLSAASLFMIPAVRSSFAWQVPLFLAIGMSRGLLRVTGSTDAFEAVDDHERQHGLTAALVHSGLDIGKIAGPVIGGVAAELAGLAAVFRVLPAVLLGLYVALFLAARSAVKNVRHGVSGASNPASASHSR
jgi:predicted MFS family arabinose efflux permease